jgi:transcriptional regulator with XRE-family HTH domain
LNDLDRDEKDMRKRFGERVRLRRKELGISQPQLSEKTGIAASHISNVESGWSNPSLELMARLVRALDVELCDMLKP